MTMRTKLNGTILPTVCPFQYIQYVNVLLEYIGNITVCWMACGRKLVGPIYALLVYTVLGYATP